MRIHYSVLILLLIYLYTNMLIPFFIFFSSILLHECGHMIFILLFGGKIKKVELTIFGGRVDCIMPKNTFLEAMLINLGGVFVNIIILLIDYKDYKHSLYIIEYNKLLIIFNLIPIFPLDGYRVCEEIFSRIFNPGKAFKVQSYLSCFLIIVLFIISVIYNSIGLILITILLFLKNIERIRKKDAIILKGMIKLFA